MTGGGSNWLSLNTKCYRVYRPPSGNTVPQMLQGILSPSVTRNNVPHNQGVPTHNPNLKVKVTAVKGISLTRDKVFTSFQHSTRHAPILNGHPNCFALLRLFWLPKYEYPNLGSALVSYQRYFSAITCTVAQSRHSQKKNYWNSSNKQGFVQFTPRTACGSPPLNKPFHRPLHPPDACIENCTILHWA